jgi:hypothetical protein
MEHIKTHGKAYHGLNCCGMKSGHLKRSHGMRIGLFVLMMSVLWMSAVLGWFNPSFFGPMVLMSIGCFIIVSAFFRSNQGKGSRQRTKE